MADEKMDEQFEEDDDILVLVDDEGNETRFEHIWMRIWTMKRL